MKLTDQQIVFLKLVKRSAEKVGCDWAPVSEVLRKLVETNVAEQPDLYEIGNGSDVMTIRLTEKGKILGEYL